MEAKFKVDDDANCRRRLSEPTADRVLGGAGADQAAVGGDHVGGHHIVATETASASQPANAARQGETGYTRR